MDKKRRWAARSAVAEHPDAPLRLRRCGRDRHKPTVEVIASGASAWFGNVIRCRSRICPVCHIAKRGQLAHEITHVVDARTAETKQMPLLLTLTIRHSAEDPVSICRAVRECWRKLQQGRPWRDLRARARLSWIVAEEITYGENGWHPHMHALLLPRVRFDWVDAAGWIYEEWAGIVERMLGAGNVPSPDRGTDLRPCTAARYLTKLGLEMTDAGGAKGRATLALLDAGMLDKYVELQVSRRGARDLSWSRDLTPYRKTMPPPPPAELKLRLRGSEYERLWARGHDACLATLEAAAHGGAAQEIVEWYIGRLAEPQDALELERAAGPAADLRHHLEAAGEALAGLGLGRRSRVDPDADDRDRELAQLEQRVWMRERRRRAAGRPEG